MKRPRTKNWRWLLVTWVETVVLVAVSSTHTRADPLIEVIDIWPIISIRYDLGNPLGLAFDPELEVFYLAYGSDNRGAFIYTLDAHGNLLHEFDFESAYHPDSYITSLSYDPVSGHLFALAQVPVGVTHLLEMDPGTFAIISDRIITDTDGGGGIHVEGDGIWQARFSEDVLRHYSRDLQFVEDVSVATSFPGSDGPLALTAAFDGGLFVVDHFSRRLVHVDRAGHEIADATVPLGNPWAVAIDARTRRIFVLVGNFAILVLSEKFIGPVPTTITIDIRPGDFPNSINPRSQGVIPVAILTAGTFDATTVDPLTVQFGPLGARDPQGQGHFEDVDGDGDLDVVLHFRTQATGLRCSMTSASLTGTTFNGQQFTAFDSVRTVGCP